MTPWEDHFRSAATMWLPRHSLLLTVLFRSTCTLPIRDASVVISVLKCFILIEAIVVRLFANNLYIVK